MERGRRTVSQVPKSSGGADGREGPQMTATKERTGCLVQHRPPQRSSIVRTVGPGEQRHPVSSRPRGTPETNSSTLCSRGQGGMGSGEQQGFGEMALGLSEGACGWESRIQAWMSSYNEKNLEILKFWAPPPQPWSSCLPTMKGWLNPLLLSLHCCAPRRGVTPEQGSAGPLLAWTHLAGSVHSLWASLLRGSWRL